MQINHGGLHIIIKGRVQGVCFRHYTEQRADQLGITGTVKNLYDGSVEIFAFGDALKLEAFKKWCYRGPRDAFVKQLECQKIAFEEVKGFETIGQTAFTFY